VEGECWGKTSAVDATRILAGALAVNRTLFGANYLVRPRSAEPSWIGRAARKPGAQVIIRSQGARDVALGLGALWALARGGDSRAWMAAHALSDGADAAATWAALDRLPRRRARRALAIAGGSTAIAVLGAARLGGGRARASAGQQPDQA
jgi:hypothetical protein